MNAAKDKVRNLLEMLSEDCSFEDIQYHLYVVEKINRGLDRADREGTMTQEEAERKLQKWTS